MTKSSKLGPLASFVSILVIVLFWFVQFSPTYIGGPATYTYVVGKSMEPTYSSGDLLIALNRATKEYFPGEVVVFIARDSLSGETIRVVHRLVEKNDQGLWITKGDNQQNQDPWLVSTEQLVGSVEIRIPQLGSIIKWVKSNPYLSGLFFALFALLANVRLIRKRVSPDLANILQPSLKERSSELRTKWEVIAFLLCGFAWVAGVGLSYFYYSRDPSNLWLWIPSLVMTTFSFSTFFVLYLRLFDGKWIPEPKSSMYALSGRTYRVDKFPPMAEIQEVDSAIALRDIAEKYRLPILHRINKKTGFHEYMLITVQKGTFLYVAKEKRIRGSFNRSMNKTLA